MSRLLRIAQVADVPVIIVHLSTREGLEEVRAARRRGQTVYVETCPQYLLLDESVYDAADYLDAARYVCAPPIRGAADRDALWEALKSGEIQTVATDHCSFTLEQKRMGREGLHQDPRGPAGGGGPRRPPLHRRGGGGADRRGSHVPPAQRERRQALRLLAPEGGHRPGQRRRHCDLRPGGGGRHHRRRPHPERGLRPLRGHPRPGDIHQVYLRGTLAVDRGQVLAGPDGQFIPRGRSVL